VRIHENNTWRVIGADAVVVVNEVNEHLK